MLKHWSHIAAIVPSSDLVKRRSTLCQLAAGVLERHRVVDRGSRRWSETKGRYAEERGWRAETGTVNTSEWGGGVHTINVKTSTREYAWACFAVVGWEYPCASRVASPEQLEPAPQETERKPLESLRVVDDNGSMSSVPVVLVVDDEENIAYVLNAALRLSGFDVVMATTGREALAAVQERHPDLIVLDVMLPDLDGFEVCRRLRQDRDNTPVLFLTARDDTEDRLRGLTIGGDDYVAKPFSVEEVVARVRVILRRSGVGVEERVMRCGPVTLDDDAHLVSCNGVEVVLSPTEYKLLRFLMHNQGRALTRAQILDHVWDYDFNGESTVVETFMSSLRRKIDAGEQKLIATIRNVGYRMSAPV
jgi:two-component system, OmpR family, response regulator